MSTLRASNDAKLVSKSLRATATKLARVRDETVREAAQGAVEEAINLGGSMKGYTLYGEVTKVTNKGNVSTATVEGVPSGFWSIKSYGRRGGYTIRSGGKRPLNLRGAGTPRSAAESVKMGGRTRGDKRWDRVIDRTAELSAQVWVKRVEKAVG